jgi:hypothetical protein
MKEMAAIFATRILTVLRTFFARLLRPATLTKEEIEVLAGKGVSPYHLADLRKR